MRVPRVLIVDDNLVVRSGLVSLLEASGIEVVGEAGDGRTAIDLARRLLPDLVLLDVRMPMLDGVAALDELTPRSKVIMLTYTDDPVVIRAAIASGASGYLVHGTFSAEELFAAVHGALDGSHPLSNEAVSALVGAVRHQPPGVRPGPHEQPPAGSPHPVQAAPGQHHPPPVPEGGRPPGPAEGVDGLGRQRGRFGLSMREVEVMGLIVQGRSNGEIAAQLFLAEKTVKNHVNRIYAKLGVASRGAAIARWIGTVGDGAE